MTTKCEGIVKRVKHKNKQPYELLALLFDRRERFLEAKGLNFPFGKRR